MGIINKVAKGKYKIVDIFLAIYLQQNNDTLLAFDDKIKIEF